MKFAFFGTDEFAVAVLETLVSRDLVPHTIITTPDKPKGRKLLMTPPPVKLWAEKRNIKVLQPEKLKDQDFLDALGTDWDLFIVAAYGKIIPESIFTIPRHKTLNIHPSLLPELRGPSPVATAILEDKKDTGLTIMQIDAHMDHGPIIVQKKYHFDEWKNREELELFFAQEGAHILADTLNAYMCGTCIPQPQDDSKAIYCHFITKDMGLIDMNDDPYFNWRKIQGLYRWPGTYFFVQHHGKNIRVAIRKAHYRDNVLTIETVVPEGKKEMLYKDFLRGISG